MTTIASLLVSLGMDTADFKKGAKDAKRELNFFQRGMQSALHAPIGGMIADKVVEAGKFMVDLVQQTFEEIDQLDELAQSSGTTATELARLQYAAVQVGATTDAVAPAMQRLNSELGQIADGGSDEAFRNIGLNAKQLLQMDPAQAFIKVTDALSRIPSEYERASAAQAIFGKGGKALANLFRTNAAELQRLASEADSSGSVLNETQLEQISRADAEVNRLMENLSGMRRQFTAEVAPIIEGTAKVVQGFTNMAKESKAAGEVLRQVFVPLHFRFFAEFADKEKSSISDVNDALRDRVRLEEQIATAKKKQAELDAAFAKQHDGFIDGLRKQFDAFKSMQERIDELKTVNAEKGEVAQQIHDLTEWTKRATEARKALTEDRDDTRQDMKSPEQILRDKLERIDAMLRAGIVQRAEWAGMKAHEIHKFNEERANDPNSPQGIRKAIEERAKQRKEDLKSPLQIWRDEQKRIDEERGLLTREEEKLARLKSDLAFFQATEKDKEAATQRGSGALERGTAAAFSASFGATPKVASEQLRVQKEIKQQLERIDAMGQLRIGK